MCKREVDVLAFTDDQARWQRGKMDERAQDVKDL